MLSKQILARYQKKQGFMQTIGRKLKKTTLHKMAGILLTFSGIIGISLCTRYYSVNPSIALQSDHYQTNARTLRGSQPADASQPAHALQTPPLDKTLLYAKYEELSQARRLKNMPKIGKLQKEIEQLEKAVDQFDAMMMKRHPGKYVSSKSRRTDNHEELSSLPRTQTADIPQSLEGRHFGTKCPRIVNGKLITAWNGDDTPCPMDIEDIELPTPASTSIHSAVSTQSPQVEYDGDLNFSGL